MAATFANPILLQYFTPTGLSNIRHMLTFEGNRSKTPPGTARENSLMSVPSLLPLGSDRAHQPGHHKNMTPQKQGSRHRAA
jgi:hypothetical protein